ncbi:hypothetical protein [Rhizobium esperanzae]|uniref:Uncharacterized protein n=1 Tax=Rhizobium esperanzae TaxID=1967781 RepID=A0A7W6W453_9HYPH|nr:hypothetical protein [Rhizobium esperanzae]MBB4235078.1 hypothetical protein [Rhizobium esperanzae]
MAIDGREGGPWRPANGTDGQDFEHHWCRHCLNRIGNNIDGCCPIIEDAAWCEQPRELIIRNGMPWCKAFREDPARPARCFFTKEMDV